MSVCEAALLHRETKWSSCMILCYPYYAASTVPPSVKAYCSIPARTLGMIFAVWEVCGKDNFHSLTESVSSLRKLRYEKDTMLDLGRDKSARVEFAAAPCLHDLCPDCHAATRDPSARNTVRGNPHRSRQNGLMGLARSGGLTGARGFEAAG